jgi:hypothetical protein
MTTEHPITPPPELVQQWAKQFITPDNGNLALDFDWFATQAARWGADQELEACCSQLAYMGVHGYNKLYEARRPKPPSLKEQALAELAEWENVMDIAPDSPIRRALEALPE